MALWSQVACLTVAVLALYAPAAASIDDADGTPGSQPEEAKEGLQDHGLLVFVAAVVRAWVNLCYAHAFMHACMHGALRLTP